MNILHDVIDTMFDFSNRELCTQDSYLYQNASKNPIFFGQVICLGYRLLRMQLNVQHIQWNLYNSNSVGKCKLVRIIESSNYASLPKNC